MNTMHELQVNQYTEVLNYIYTNLFKKMQQDIIDIFLCGGASTKNYLSTRDKLRKEFESINGFRILYPENLFMDLLNLNKDKNLLTLEQILAQNCDCICIVCESVGSFVELGAFTNNDNTFPKVIALVKTKYKNEHSFLMLGPIKYIQSKNKSNVVFFNSDLSKAKRQLVPAIRKMNYLNNAKDLDTIVGLHYFILLSLNFIRTFRMNILVDGLKEVSRKNGFNFVNAEFDIIFRAAMKLLYNEKAVERFSDNNIEYYRITQKGIGICDKMISQVNIVDKYYLCDKIRLQFLKKVYY